MRAIELFCGAGGMSLGLKRAGFAVTHAFDRWEAALKVYRANLPGVRPFVLGRPHAARAADITDLMTLAPRIASESPDIIAGGPPCQDFSLAGQRIEGTRADMTLAFAMLIVVVRPEWFLMENVPGAKKSRAWAKARSLLKRAGYGLTTEVLNASLYGVPQDRKRLIVVGRLGEADGFLASALRDAAAERPMSMRDAFGDAIGSRVYIHPRSNKRRGVYSTDESSPTVRSASRRPMPAGYEGHHGDAQHDGLVEDRVIYTRAFGAGLCVRSFNEPAPAIIRTSRERPTKRQIETQRPDELVPIETVPSLTFQQMAVVQGFPKDWVWEWDGKNAADPANRENARNRDQMVANAVPPPFAEAIGRVILARHRGETVPAIEEGFRKWLVRSKKLEGGVLRNRLSQLNRARRLILGRAMADLVTEIGALEAAPGFGSLSRSAQSDLRAALRLHAEWRNSGKPRKRNEYVHVEDWEDLREPDPPLPLRFVEKISAFRAGRPNVATQDSP